MISCEITIKEVLVDGTDKLLIGTSHYEKNLNVLFYDLRFPEEKVVMFTSEKMAVYSGDSVILSSKSSIQLDNSMWKNLLEKGNIEPDMLEAGFVLADTDLTEDGQTVKVWENKNSGLKALFRYKAGVLNALVITDKSGDVVERVYIRNFLKLKHVIIPTEIQKLRYLDKGTEKQWITIENPSIDNYDKRVNELLELAR